MARGILRRVGNAAAAMSGPLNQYVLEEQRFKNEQKLEDQRSKNRQSLEDARNEVLQMRDEKLHRYSSQENEEQRTWQSGEYEKNRQSRENIAVEKERLSREKEDRDLLRSKDLIDYKAEKKTPVTSTNQKKYQELIDLGVSPGLAAAISYGMIKEIRDTRGNPAIVDIASGNLIGSMERDPQTMKYRWKSNLSAETPSNTEVDQVPPPSQRSTGKVYQTPRGPMRWMGNGWLPQ